MDELKKRLTRELGQNLQIKIKHSQIWHLPVYPIKVGFETVRQSKMDLLMKMLLTAFREADFSETSQLSKVLLVEPIFIEHLVRKMADAGLIQKNDLYFTLTEKGISQLNAETFIDQVEQVSENLLFSPCHGKLLEGALKKAEDDQFDDYRFYDDFSDWDIEAIDPTAVRQGLQNLIPKEETPNIQTVIADIHSLAPLTPEVIPCIEFQLYHQTAAIFYARVWNTLLNEWDETLEGQINERDRNRWQEKFKESTK